MGERVLPYSLLLTDEEKAKIEKALKEGKMVIITHKNPKVKIGGDLEKVVVITK